MWFYSMKELSPLLAHIGPCPSHMSSLCQKRTLLINEYIEGRRPLKPGDRRYIFVGLLIHLNCVMA